MSKTFKTKFGALCMALILALSLAVSASATESDFTIENGVLTKYNGSNGVVTIPDNVTKIGNQAFSNCTSLTSVTIPGSVTEIGGGAFEGCTSLTNVIIPGSVTEIGRSAFCACMSLTSVTIPDSVTKIRNQTFSNCTSLTSITIPESVTEIEGEAFYNCASLTNVTIPDSVTAIKWNTFASCMSLTSVTIPDNVTEIEGEAFYNCTSLTSATIPASVTEIKWNTFGSCTSLTSVTIPDSMTAIYLAAFDGCTGLKDVYYTGSQTEWNKIYISDDNDPLKTAVIHYNSKAPAVSPQPATMTTTAMPTNDPLTANGTLQKPTVYKISGSNYFKIRDLAAILNGTEKQFSVGYDGKLQSITVATGQGYAKQSADLAGAPTGGNQTAAVSKDTIYINGQKVNVDVYKIGGNNYFKLRDLGKALNFYVGWTKERGVFIETNKPYQE